ncbi:hypothetical protein [Halorussus caseinilyticus]|uniref:hypothetical protein n=1 Tax=Halorussus caseinilyticus TaxID=3034025 RepID=UPI0023E7FA4C|nr:hypothetical protein [Halorussus sp. DT72]
MSRGYVGQRPRAGGGFLGVLSSDSGSRGAESKRAGSCFETTDFRDDRDDTNTGDA